MRHGEATDAHSNVPSLSFVLLGFPPSSWDMQYYQPNLQHAEVIEFSIFAVELASEDIKCCIFSLVGGSLEGRDTHKMLDYESLSICCHQKAVLCWAVQGIQCHLSLQVDCNPASLHCLIKNP